MLDIHKELFKSYSCQHISFPAKYCWVQNDYCFQPGGTGLSFSNSSSFYSRSWTRKYPVSWNVPKFDVTWVLPRAHNLTIIAVFLLEIGDRISFPVPHRCTNHHQSLPRFPRPKYISPSFPVCLLALQVSGHCFIKTRLYIKAWVFEAVPEHLAIKSTEVCAVHRRSQSWR